MKTFRVFRHSTLGFEAVKVGYSWPGCFFTCIWAFIKKLWGYGLGLLGIIVFLTIIDGVFENEKSNIAKFVAFLFQIGLYIFVGFKGNEWRENNLRKRGFELVETIQAENPDAAIGKVVKV